MNPMRNISISMAAVFVIFSMSACQGERTGDFVLVIPSENDIQTLNPLTLSDPHTSRIVWQMYEGLIGLDEAGEPVPVIAESWEASEDFTEWTFTIRPDVYFHRSSLFDTPENRRSVTAKDVELSYENFARGFGSFVFTGLVEGFDRYVANATDDISGFTAVDDMTFRVSLTRPDPSFIYRITSPYLSVMPAEALANPGEIGESIHIGTGPFIFSHRTSTEVYLERNTDYWKETAGNAEEVLFRVEKNQQLRLTQFRNGQFSLMQIPVTQIPEFFLDDELRTDYSGQFHSFTTTTYNIHYLGINNDAIPDVNLRRAIALAIDKDRIVENLIYSYGKTAASPVLPGMRNYTPPEGLNYSPDDAREELRESGYGGDTITLFVSDAPNSEQLGQVIQSDLSKAGINVQIQQMDFNSLISRLLGNDRPEMFLMFSEWVFSAPELILDSYHSEKFPNPNLFAYSNSEVDEMIDMLPELKEREEINRLNYEIEELALSEVPAVWLYHQNNVYLMKNEVSGFSVNQHNHWNLADVRFD